MILYTLSPVFLYSHQTGSLILAGHWPRLHQGWHLGGLVIVHLLFPTEHPIIISPPQRFKEELYTHILNMQNYLWLHITTLNC